MKYTVIWQSAKHPAREWISEVFGPYIEGHILDGERKVVVDHALLVDDFVYARDGEYYRNFLGKDAFLLHFQDEFYELGINVYKNFRGVFRAFWAGIFNENHIHRLPVGYTNETKNKGPVIPASERIYLWSFLGQVNKSSRPDMVRELAHVEPHFFFATDALAGWTVYNRKAEAPRRFTREECAALLLNSSFSPAPMGNAHIECYRPYEALESGSIPIVEKRMTLDYYRELLGPNPMLAVRSWAEAQKVIADMLKNPKTMDALQTECIEWWSSYKKTFSEKAGEFLQRCSQNASPIDNLVSDWGQSRIWSILELLRHHDSRALLRRVGKVSQRLIKSGKIRVAYSSTNTTGR